VFVALLAWRCRLNYGSLTVLGVPSLCPLFFSSVFFFHLAIWLECDGCLKGVWRGGARGLVAGWAGQSGVLAPWDVTAVTAPSLRRHLPSISDLGVD